MRELSCAAHPCRSLPAAGFAAVKADKCIALAYDTGLPQNSADGLPQVAGIPPVMTAPCECPRGGAAFKRAWSGMLWRLDCDTCRLASSRAWH